MDDLRMSRRMLKSSGSSQSRTWSRDLGGNRSVMCPGRRMIPSPPPPPAPLHGGHRHRLVDGPRRLRGQRPSADTFVASGTTNGRNWSTVNGMTMASGRLIYATTTGTLSTVDFPAGLPTGSATVVSGAAVDGRSWQSRA
jgi:hypothetical protein